MILLLTLFYFTTTVLTPELTSAHFYLEFDLLQKMNIKYVSIFFNILIFLIVWWLQPVKNVKTPTTKFWIVFEPELALLDLNNNIYIILNSEKTIGKDCILYLLICIVIFLNHFVVQFYNQILIAKIVIYHFSDNYRCQVCVKKLFKDLNCITVLLYIS